MDSRLSSCIAPTLLIAALAAPGCVEKPAPEETVEATRPVRLLATAPTVAWLAEEVGGPGLETELIWPEGSELTEQQLIALSEADLVVQHGAGLDAWTGTLEVSALGLNDLSQELLLIEKEGSAHSHGDEPEHQHREPLSATWHDPGLLMSSLDALVEILDQSHPEAIDHRRADTLRGQLTELNALVDALATNLKTSKILAEDEFRYLARRLQPEVLNGGANGKRLGTTDRQLVLKKAGTPEQTLTSGEAGRVLPVVLEPLLPRPVDGFVELLRRNLGEVQRSLEALSNTDEP